MSINILMVVLTLLESGQMSAAFVNTASMKECERRSLMVRTVLETTGARIQQIACRQSTARFTSFSHDDGSPETQHMHYVIQIDPQQASIMVLPPGHTCKNSNDEGDNTISYCATSTQSLLLQDAPGTRP